MPGKIIHRVSFFLDEIPFIHNDHSAFPGIQDETSDVGILGGDAADGVNYQQGNISPLDRPH
jgi:hypothetical protein